VLSSVIKQLSTWADANFLTVTLLNVYKSDGHWIMFIGLTFLWTASRTSLSCCWCTCVIFEMKKSLAEPINHPTCLDGLAVHFHTF
jgi:hypothetical protein